MDAMDNGHVGEFKKALDTWTDQRFVSRKDIEALAMFSVYLVNLSEANDWVYDGHSFKVALPLSTLVVRGHVGGSAMVCFISGRTFTNCARIFLRRLAEDELEWRVDKYRA